MYNEIRWEECALGKKLYTKENISKAETEWLGIPELVVLKTNSDDVGLEVVHRRYHKFGYAQPFGFGFGDVFFCI